MLKKGCLLFIAIFAIALVTPYILTWSFVKNLPDMTEEEVAQRIDIPRFKGSLKESLTGYMSQQAEDADPIAKTLISAMLTQVVNKTVDTFMQPNVLAKLLETGNIKQTAQDSKKQPPSDDQASEQTESSNLEIPLIYFTSLNSYRVKVGEVFLDFHFNSNHWQLSEFHIASVKASQNPANSPQLTSVTATQPAQTLVDEIVDQTLPATLSPEQVEKAFLLLQNAFFNRMQFNNELGVEVDTLYIPNASGLSVLANWQRVLDKSGNNILQSGEATEFTSWGFSNTSMTGDIKLTANPGSSQIDKAEGMATITLPTRYHTLTLTDSDAGNSHSLGALEVIMQNSRGTGSLSLTVKGNKEDLDKLSVFALNKNGKPLKQASRMTGSSPASPDNPELIKRDMNFEYKGTIASVALFLADKAVTRTLPVRTHNKPETFFGELRSPITTSRYQEKYQPAFCSSAQQADLSTLKAVAGRSHAVFGFNTPEVSLNMPGCTNSSYGKIKWDVELFDKQGQKIDYSPENSIQEYRFKPVDTADKNPIDFHNAKGTFTVDYPIVMMTSSYGLSSNNSAVTNPGKSIYKVEVKSGQPANVFSSDIIPVRGYDSENRMLQTLDKQYKDNSVTAIFWGTPARIEVDVINQRETFTGSFDMPPAPLLPQECQGLANCS
ncbi:DUF2939 domain-containing protein [Parendozoicomonas sp. Alg238-R29]|uniref:DUF2939 domain-containing protein n=1 Tax=Parendozoicomonas sp. Alg238-R29 TaxID=2993446 RepID=UPI00248EA5AC|nr:DUF2939 domain-containing protein [Parendozoicomonas sp. Alg238-R29]